MKQLNKLLVIEDDPFSLEHIESSLKSYEYDVKGVSSAEKGLELIKKDSFDLAIVDIFLPGIDGLEFIEKYKQIDENVKFIIITGYSDEKKIIKAINIGVDNFLKKPYQLEDLIKNVKKNLKEKQKEKNQNQKNISDPDFENKPDNKKTSHYDDNFEIVGESSKLRSCLDKAKKAAKYGLNTFISGETGTGKELIAQYIHKQTQGKREGFIPVNCPAIPNSLFESELFGYERGAFTGARKSKAGLVELANNGILFLDEISEISKELQAKLLRIIETKKFRKVSSSEWKDINFQIIATTNRDLDDLLSDSILREDLYHRLAELHINLPPMRERKGDIVPIFEYYVDNFCKKYSVKSKSINNQQKSFLRNFDWKGNARQIKNCAKQYCIFSNGSTQNIDLKEFLQHQKDNPELSKSNTEFIFKFEEGKFDEIDDVKKILIKNALDKFDGNKAQTARYLGISTPSLYNLMKKYDLYEPES